MEKIWSWEIKGRLCDDERKQQLTTEKGETTSPTIVIAAILIMAALDAHERRELAVIHIPVPHLFINVDDIMYLVMNGQLEELIA